MSADYKPDPGILALTNPLSPSKVHAMLGGDEHELLGVQDGEIPPHLLWALDWRCQTQ